MAGGLRLNPETSVTVSDDSQEVADLKARVEMLTQAMPDMSAYAKKTDIPVIPDISDLAKKTDIPDVSGLAPMSAIPNVADFATREEIPDISDLAPMSAIPDITDLAKKTDIPVVPDVSEFAKATDLLPLAKKTDIPVVPDLTPYAMKTDIPVVPDVSGLAKKTDIPVVPDLTPYARKTDIPSIPDISGLAKKTDIPDVSGLAPLSAIPSIAGLASKTDLTPLAKKTDIPDVSGFANKTDLTPLAKKTDIPDVSGLATKTEVAAKPDMSTIQATLLADDMPSAEALSAAAGTATKAPRRDHVHPRLTETFEGTTNAQGQATITFSKSYALKPAIIPQSVSAGAPVSWDISYIGSTGAWTGVTITAYKIRALPTLSAISLSAILTGVINGVNAIVTALSGFNTAPPTANLSFTGFVLKSSAG